MDIETAIATLQAAGYRVSKPRVAKIERPALNAVGKPFSPQYDPKYRMKYHTPMLKRAQNIDCYISPAQWAEKCARAKVGWELFLQGKQAYVP